jgi:uncharacterized membrane protein YfcA
MKYLTKDNITTAIGGIGAAAGAVYVFAGPTNPQIALYSGLIAAACGGIIGAYTGKAGNNKEVK